MTESRFGYLLFTLSIFMAGFAGSFAIANDASDVGEFPKNACFHEGDCSADQKRMVEAFLRASNISAQHMPAVYSGNCHHSSPSYDPEVTHYAVAVLEQDGEAIYYNGAFNFFGSKNPFVSMTLEEAHRSGLDKRDSNHQLKLFESHAFADFNPGKIPVWRYYFREANDGKTLLLLGEWGKDHFLACELQKNP